MTPLFRKKQADRTILILDIENGSVASALVRISPHEQPKLFGETRKHLPVQHTRDGKTLYERVTSATRDVMRSASELAARIRGHKQTAHIGTIEGVAIFLSSPWGMPNLSAGRPEFMPDMQRFLVRELHQWVGDVPVSFHTGAGAATFGLQALYPDEPSTLLFILGGEVGELLHINNRLVHGHATMPHGYHSAMRTLKTHGGLTEHEARSAFHLRHMEEPLRAAGEHIAYEFAQTAKELITHGDADSVVIYTHEPIGRWVADALSNTSHVDSLFPQGGTVRALRSEMLKPHISVHSSSPDMPLLLQALFVDSHSRQKPA